MIVNWKDDYTVGFPEIDDQHKKIINMINLLYNSIIKNKSSAIINSILQDMMEYSIYHFDSEESLLRSLNADDSIQKKEHSLYIDMVGQLFSEYLNHDKKIYSDTIDFLWSWWKNHILKTDIITFQDVKK